MQKTNEQISHQASVGREERFSAKRHQVIKLGIDAHADFYVVARQIDGSLGERAVSLNQEQLLEFVSRQLELAETVYSCYEAGCFGFVLHRKLEALGVVNFVICPMDLDQRHKRVKTDRVDAAELLSRLDRYVAGNSKAFSVVRVPTVAEELARSRCRQRETFKKELKRWGMRGKSLLLNYGIHWGWGWWREERYQKLAGEMANRLESEVCEQVLSMLREIRQMAVLLEQKLLELTEELEKAQARRSKARPKGVGLLSGGKIMAEICDFHRFSNRRQVASYTGLCPGVSGSGGDFRGLSISKCGNARLRETLVELAWLVSRYQPAYPPVVKWKWALEGGKRAVKKKAIVAIARRLVIDLWRIDTGRASAAELGLTLMKEAA